MYKKGERVLVLEIHGDDNSPMVKVGDVVVLTRDATPYNEDDPDDGFAFVYTDGPGPDFLTYARVGPPPATFAEEIKQRAGMVWSDDTQVDPAVAAIDAAEAAYAAQFEPRPAFPIIDDDAPPPVFMSTDSAVRKMMPVASGCMNYFPDALMLVSWVSRVGNDKHNPGQPLHWAKDKSADEPDAEARHMLDIFRGLPPDPGLEPLGALGHYASKAWRALADLQRACDAERASYLTDSGLASDDGDG